MRIISVRHALPAVSIAAAMGLAAPAHAFEFKISGQVDRAITAADNGKNSDIGFVDNSGSNTRFRFTGEQDMDNGLTVGFAYEIGLGENSSATFDVNNGGGDNADFLDNRLANVYITGSFGTFALGKVDGAVNGASEVDYSGTTYLGGGVDFGDYAGGLTFLDNNNNGITQLGLATNSFDALSRQNAIRYDTPTYNGLTLSASLDNGHAYEISPRYEASVGDGGKFGVALDYVDSQSQGRDISPNGVVNATGARFQEYGGSASVLLPTGLNFTGSYKRRRFVDAGIPSASNYFGSVGYILGKHHFALSYDRTNDYLNDGSKGSAYGAAYVYDWTDSIELYGSYHLYTLDDAIGTIQDADGNLLSTGNKVNAQDINQLYAGVRLKFL